MIKTEELNIKNNDTLNYKDTKIFEEVSIVLVRIEKSDFRSLQKNLVQKIYKTRLKVFF